MKKTRLIKLLIICALFTSFGTVSYCADGTIRMQVVSGGKRWNNISVSEAYEECEKLNSSTSTLGTTALKAHLTTDADWSAMAIFSVSQYGGAASNEPSQTTGNVSGIYNTNGYTYSTGLLETAASTSNSYISGLFDGSDVKPYVKKWSKNRTETNFVGFTNTWGWYGAGTNYGADTSVPVSVKSGLFGVILGYNTGWSVSSGGRNGNANATFRPVIWN